MTPYLQIRNVYIEHWQPPEMTWETLVGWHLENHRCHVVKDPDFFVMGRPVCKEMSDLDIRDLRIDLDPTICNAWFLYAFAGDMRKAWRSLPYNLPFFAWERLIDGKDRAIRFYEAARVQDFLNILHVQ